MPTLSCHNASNKSTHNVTNGHWSEGYHFSANITQFDSCEENVRKLNKICEKILLGKTVYY